MIDAIIEGIIERERARPGQPEFTDRASDAGGPTKYGITLPTLSDYLGRPATVDELKRLTLDDARTIYRAIFVVRPGFAGMDEPLRTQLIDFGVHSHPRTAIKALQEIMRVSADGVIGPNTKKAIAEHSTKTLACRLWEFRLQFMARLTESDVRKKTGRTDTNAENIEGWINRMLKINPWRSGQ